MLAHLCPISKIERRTSRTSTRPGSLPVGNDRKPPGGTRDAAPGRPSGRRELHSCNSKNPRSYRDPGVTSRRQCGAIWRIPEPPILFLLVGTRGNAGNGKESTLQNADVAQLVEHHLAKVDVASSNLVVRSQDTVTAKVLRNPVYTVGWPRGEAAACKAVYTGSNPVPTSVKTMVSGIPDAMGDWRSGSALP